MIQYIPQQGNVDDFWERFSQYVTQFYPEWKSKISKTSDEKFRQLLEVSGDKEDKFHLPPEYLIFLKNMGEKPENIFFRGDYSLYIDELMKIYSWYKDDLEATNGDANNTEESVFHIVAHNDISESEIIIDKRNKHIYEVYDEENPFDEEQSYVNERYYSESFEKMIFQSLLDYYLIYRGMHFLIADEDEIPNLQSAIAWLDQFCENNGFKKAWISDDVHYIADNGINTIYFDLENRSVRGCIIGEDLEGILDLLIDIREFICRKSDMERSSELQIDEEEHLKKTADILVFATKGAFRFQKNAEGFAYISRSIALYPTTQNLLIRAGKYAESYQYAPAIEDYKRAIDLEKDSSKKAEIYVELVHCYIENKEYDQAKLYFQRALENYRIATEGITRQT